MAEVISLFSGCGGLDLGFEKAGFDIKVANDFDKIISKNFKLNHPNTHMIEKSIKQVQSQELLNYISGEVDGIVGGPPCQSWSEAGSMRGIDDDRGKLFFDYIRLIAEIQPRFFLAENVSGMLAKRNEEVVNHILSLFDEAGYTITLSLANAKDYNTPQERKRIFFIGFRKDLNINFIFPTGSTLTKNKPTLRDSIWDLQETAVPANENNKHNQASINNNEYFIGGFSPRFMSRNRVKGWDEQAYTVQASGRQCQLHPQAPKMVKVEKDKFKFAEGFEDLYRRMTVREIARIQGFPDSFKFEYSAINDGYKMIGNAVPVELAYEIGISILDSLGE